MTIATSQYHRRRRGGVAVALLAATIATFTLTGAGIAPAQAGPSAVHVVDADPHTGEGRLWAAARVTQGGVLRQDVLIGPDWAHQWLPEDGEVYVSVSYEPADGGPTTSLADHERIEIGRGHTFSKQIPDLLSDTVSYDYVGSVHVQFEDSNGDRIHNQRFSNQVRPTCVPADTGMGLAGVPRPGLCAVDIPTVSDVRWGDGPAWPIARSVDERMSLISDDPLLSMAYYQRHGNGASHQDMDVTVTDAAGAQVASLHVPASGEMTYTGSVIREDWESYWELEGLATGTYTMTVEVLNHNGFAPLSYTGSFAYEAAAEPDPEPPVKEVPMVPLVPATPITPEPEPTPETPEEPTPAPDPTPTPQVPEVPTPEVPRIPATPDVPEMPTPVTPPERPEPPVTEVPRLAE